MGPDLPVVDIYMDRLMYENESDGVKVRVELDAADQLEVRLKRIEVEAPSLKRPVEAILRRQAAAIVSLVTFAGELKVIQADGVSDTVQIRSKKPEGDGDIEVILRKGNFISLEPKPAALHIKRKDFEKLVDDLMVIAGGNAGTDA